jgi:hypothetical protein
VLALTTALARAQLALARAGGDARPPAADDEDDYSLSAEQILAARAAAAAGAAAGGKGGGGGGAAAGKGKAAAAAAGKPGAGAAAELAAAADALHWACELAAAFPDASASAVLTLVSVQAALGAKEPWDLGAQHGWYGRHARAGALIEALRLGLRDDAPAALAEIERQLTVPPAAGSAAGSAAAAPAPLPAAGLWALLAERGLRAGQMPCVVRACTTALALLDATGALAGRAQLAPAEWRPFASAEWLHGVALADLAAGSARHSAELRARLRGEAAGHFTTAATYALRAESAAQVCQCAFAFWEQALPLAREPSTRAAAARSARAVLETLKLAQALDAAAGGGAGLAVAPPAAAGAAAVGRPRRAAAGGGGGLDADDADDGGGADGDSAPAVARLRQRMYGLVLATLAQAGRYTEGLAVLDEAFALLPPRCHAPLWEQRVSIMVLGGRGRLVAGEMARLKDEPAELRARVWLALARAAGSRAETLAAFQRALAALATEPLAKAEVHVQFGEWLFGAGFATRDAEDQLLAALDELVDLDDEAGGEGGAGGVESDGEASLADGGGGRSSARGRSQLGRSLVSRGS